MNIVAVVQARMGSSRLPGKVMKDLSGEPMLARVVKRVSRAATLNKVVIATSAEPGDQVIADFCDAHSVAVFRGSELDVLDRYYQAARAHAADVIVRITSDCPLIEPRVLDRVVSEFQNSRPDYASNTLVRTYPRGLDVEVVSITGLERAWHEASKPYQRVHVMPYFYENPTLFRCLNVSSEQNYSEYRWTVDTPEDLAFVRSVYEQFENRDYFSWRDVIAMLEKHPELVALNRDVQQKSLQDG
jgi:spore coat polysaccharide biosynthesis protein SpsF